MAFIDVCCRSDLTGLYGACVVETHVSGEVIAWGWRAKLRTVHAGDAPVPGETK